MARPMRHPWRSALVTGASSGIGLEIARLLGAAGVPTLVVARRLDRLEALAAEHPCLTPVEADLATEAGIAEIERRAGDVDLLVNNAGMGRAGRFDEVSLDSHRRMIDVNVAALVALTRAAVGPMGSRRRGWILQVSSVAGFQPGPTSATYSATKAFVTSLSEALHEEMRGRGVSVTALCPGYTRSEFHAVSGSAASVTRVPAWAWMSSADVAEAGLRGAEDRRAVVVPGLLYAGLAAASGSLPRSVVRRIMGRAAHQLR